MSGVVVVDDHLLVLHLAGLDHWLPEGASVATTASWWFRLARALERAGGGSLSTLVSAFDPDDRGAVEQMVRNLPVTVTVAHPRDTVPQAAALSARFGLNLLAADALATVIVLGGALLVAAADDGARLRDAAASLGIHYETVKP